MKNFPYIEANFIVEGKLFDIALFTKEIGILPTETREIDDFPSIIKNNSNIPRELQPRCIWSITQKEEFCRTIQQPIHNIISQLIGKEEIINSFCKKNKLERALIITIHAETMDLPEIILSSKIISYFGSIESEISFDIYTY